MSDKTHEALLKEADKLVKKNEHRKAIKTLLSALEMHRTPTTLLRISEVSGATPHNAACCVSKPLLQRHAFASPRCSFT
eukprot:1907995-Prymnesium_polylepis.1